MLFRSPVLVRFKKKKPEPALKMKDVLAAEKQGERLSPRDHDKGGKLQVTETKVMETEKEPVENPENQRLLRLPR